MSNNIHTVIKINLMREGYLINYPYHMISDSEMCDAFLADDDTGYFFDYYPLLDESLRTEYEQLVSDIRYYISQCKDPHSDGFTFPDWIYSYMLGSTISVNSDGYDIQDLAALFNVDVPWEEFTAELSRNCLEASTIWIKKLPSEEKQHRPPTMFGEPHVIKYLRLQTSESL